MLRDAHTALGGVCGHEARREKAVGELMRLHQSEQSRWFKDRGFEQSAREDTCWRGFFDETREGRANSHVERLSAPTRMLTNMNGMFTEASRFFGARGSIFNLKRTESATRQEQADIKSARAKLMNALQRDGKSVPSDMRKLLQMDAVLSDCNVQRAIEGLAKAVVIRHRARRDGRPSSTNACAPERPMARAASYRVAWQCS